jgi:glycosyltransferase 2 family protein
MASGPFVKRLSTEPQATERELDPPAARPAAPKRRRGSRKLAMALIGIGTSVLFTWIATRKISVHDVRESLSLADYGWLVPCIVLTFVTGWLRAVRWRMLFIRPESVTTGQSFGALSIGLMFNNLLPSRAGEVPRLLALRRASGLSGFEVGMTILVERLLDVFVLALAAVALWPALPDRSWIHALCLICAGIVGASILLVAGLALFRRPLAGLLHAVLSRVPVISEERVHSIGRGVAAGSRILLEPNRLAIAVGLTALLWAAAGLSGWVLFPAFHLHTSALAPWLLLLANSFALTIPSSSGAIGVYEASIQAALVAYGVSKSTALSFALVLHAVNFLPIIVVGGLASWLMGRQPAHSRFRRE